MQAKQLGLIGFVDQAIGNVFAGKAIVNAKGETVGTTVGVRGKKDIAKLLGLEGKGNKAALEAAILEQGDSALTKVKGEIAALGPDWTLRKVTSRTVSGEQQITVVMREVKRVKGATDEQVAQALGWTVEQVRETRARQTAQLAGKTIDMTPKTEEVSA